MLSHRESVITLIPKPGKPRDSIKGWRPISLLNVDFKIISAAIANRLKTVINDLISTTQTAYIKGRYIGENTRLMYDVIEHVNNTSSSGIIMAVDFEAAFDTVSWNFLKGLSGFLNCNGYTSFATFQIHYTLAIPMICIMSILERQLERYSHFKVRYLVLKRYLLG